MTRCCFHLCAFVKIVNPLVRVWRGKIVYVCVDLKKHPTTVTGETSSCMGVGTADRAWGKKSGSFIPTRDICRRRCTWSFSGGALLLFVTGYLSGVVSRAGTVGRRAHANVSAVWFLPLLSPGTNYPVLTPEKDYYKKTPGLNGCLARTRCPDNSSFILVRRAPVNAPAVSFPPVCFIYYRGGGSIAKKTFFRLSYKIQAISLDYCYAVRINTRRTPWPAAENKHRSTATLRWNFLREKQPRFVIFSLACHFDTLKYQKSTYFFSMRDFDVKAARPSSLRRWIIHRNVKKLLRVVRASFLEG